MVRPYSSKRKLFNGSREQKENEPDEIEENFLNTRQEIKLQVNHLKSKNRSQLKKGSAISEDRTRFEIDQLDSSVICEDVGSPVASRPVMPMSERQQIAFLMQMSSPSSSPGPHEYIEKNPSTPQVCRSASKTTKKGETPLHLAAIKGDKEKVLQLIEQGSSVNEIDYAGWTPLHEACNRGFVKIATLLIESGANVNAKGLDNETPLHDACVNNHYQIVKLLLKSGADTDAINRRGKSPRDICRSPKVLSLIEQSKSGSFLSSNSGIFEEGPPCAELISERLADCKMSRRTPPANKIEEKTAPVSTSTSTGGTSTSSSSGVTSQSTTTNRPESPRVNLRLPQVSRTPEKTPHPNEPRVNPESEDIYEFRCSKDDSKEDTEEKPDLVKAELASVAESRQEKRNRDSDPEEEERKKRRKDEGCPDKTTKSNNRANAPAPPSPDTCAAEPPVATSNITDQKSPTTTAASSPKPPTENAASDNEDAKNDVAGAPKVPPLKIVLPPTATCSEQETSSQTGNRQLPYVVSSGGAEDKQINSTETKQELIVKPEDAPSTVASSTSETTSVTVTSTACSISTASSAITSTKPSSSTVNTVTSNTCSTAKEEKGATRITRSQRGGVTTSVGPEETVAAVKQETPVEEPAPSSITDIVPPRKRKLKKVCEVQEPPPPAPLADQTPTITNCYEMFRKIRSQVERRRKLLVPVQPKPPQGFKDYLMNRCTYALSGRDDKDIPTLKPPKSIASVMVELFNEQEQARHKLRLEHLIEREKLVLSVEQEILRVHGRAARALANQVLPFSVCSILKDEEVYNIITPEQEEKDRNARSRYNGRLFISWLQDVDDKWEKIKEAMVLRHHNESESLHAVQKMAWEWKLKELNLIDANTRPTILPEQVPMVKVSDFDLLPDVNP